MGVWIQEWRVVEGRKWMDVRWMMEVGWIDGRMEGQRPRAASEKSHPLISIY